MVTRSAVLGLLCGLLFGAGLALSGMADPARVRGFLDLFGAFDPTLAFVMIGALVPMAIAWRIRRRMDKPLVETAFDLPPTDPIDARLVIGAALFGVGWGIAGLCPGPALVDLALAPLSAIPFVLAMALGMFLQRLLGR
ncbi:DUF6691 family protein [Methylosinus sp. Sm6]|uniref:DUF6691 family protein n=1 Tax=Methylosinus sp. Sm6 TaxID=2866948 RepID=UPI001C99BD9B|nr:DUF6691 family protein [Methylosinus sp. Sm6]MBY6241730.1 YeeE/YedE family protein [Methylosinus sp. Sm6]